MEIHILSWMMDIFFIFTLHILYRQVLGVRTKNRFRLIAGWAGCFLSWNLCSYLLAEYPPINSICGIIINFFVMYILYIGSFRVKIILVFVVTILGIIAETITSFCIMMLKIDINSFAEGENNILYLGSAASKIFWFIFVKIITRISKKDKQIKIAMTEWIEIFTVPIGSLIIFYLVAWNNYFNITLDKLVIFAILLIINIVTYYTYQKVQMHAGELRDSEILRQQNEYYRLRFEDAEKQWKNLRKIRHDLKNHYILEMSYLESKRYEELHALYLEELGALKRKGNIIESGNLGIDSILNYKVECAREAGITVKHEIAVSGEISVSNGDLTTLLGNLLDNAIEAVLKMPKDKREIELKLRADETAILFIIGNPFKGAVKRNGRGEIVTTKSDKRNHGIGLKAVEEIVNRHKGTMQVECENEWFQIKIFLYMEEKEKII